MSTHYGTLLGEQLYDADQRRAAIAAEGQTSQAVRSDLGATSVSEKTTAGDVSDGGGGPIDEEVVYCQFDGGFIFSDADWQEVKLGRVFLQSDCQQTENEERGNRIVKSEYAASLGHYTEFTRRYEVLVQEANLPGRSLVFITDGAVWMRNWMNDRYPEATQILDFFHVCEHLGEFAKEVVSGLRKNHRLWYERQKEELKQGNLSWVIKRIEQLPLRAAAAKRKRQRLLKYFGDNAYRMKYDQYRQAGYMIGSGAIEAAHRTVVQKRMKLSGQRWSDTGAQPMLNLRCAFKSGRRRMVKDLINQAA
jgi:hypothetical protein